MNLKVFISEAEFQKNSFTILIPFRDEEKKLENCILRVLDQKYPTENIEIITINDHSIDKSENIIKELSSRHSNIKPINLVVENGKKEAIEKGISVAKNTWIVTLDADCEIGENWIDMLNQYIHKTDKQYVVMPVIFKEEKTLFEKIQSLEFLTLVATSAACIQGQNPLMSNGANLAFTKDIFKLIHGFEGNKHISSGDDVFLLHKIIQADKNAIGYLHHQEVIAYTHPVSTLNEFIGQRVRWGSKAVAYQSIFSRSVAGLILLINFTIILSIFFAIFDLISWLDFVIIFFVKYLFDMMFIQLSTPFYGKEKLRFYAPLLSILYPIYIFVISFLSFVYQPLWKGRKINKK